MNVLCAAVGGYMGIVCQPEEVSLDAVRQNYASHISKYGLSFGTKEEYEFRFE